MIGTGTEALGKKLQNYYDRPGYWEESWELEDTCCRLNSGEKLSSNAGMKNSKKLNSNDNNNDVLLLKLQ